MHTVATHLGESIVTGIDLFRSITLNSRSEADWAKVVQREVGEP